MFGGTPDPDFMEAMLLEQYQAQISSALTPAFASDSSPELAAEAVNVCATFISTGIVTDMDRMGRIHKVLVSALESFSGKSLMNVEYARASLRREQFKQKRHRLAILLASRPMHRSWSAWQCSRPGLVYR